jgi:hypothetical protein
MFQLKKIYKKRVFLYPYPCFNFYGIRTGASDVKNEWLDTFFPVGYSVLFIELGYGAWPQFCDCVDHISNDCCPLCTFGCRDERHPEAAVIKADALHQALDHEHPLCCLVVAFKVVAVTKVAA